MQYNILQGRDRFTYFTISHLQQFLLDAMVKSSKTEPWRIKLSDEDLAAGTTDLAITQAGIESFHEYGFFILENAIPHKILDKFHNQFTKDLKKKIEAGTITYNHGNKTNFSFSPPLSPDWIHEEVWANKHAGTVIENIIGPRPQLNFVGSNINMPQKNDGQGIKRQAVHADPYGITHKFSSVVEAFVFTRDCDVHNGSTEIWPGSHTNFRGKEDQNENGRGWIKKEVFTERAKIAPPIQPFVPKGSICLQDLKIWHSGMPNFDNKPRIMLAFIYYPRWFRCHMRITLPESARKKVESFTGYDLVGGTKFVPGPVDHLDNGQTVMTLNFTQDPRLTLTAQRNAVDLLASKYDPVILLQKKISGHRRARLKLITE